MNMFQPYICIVILRSYLHDMVCKRASALPKLLTTVKFFCVSVLFVVSVVFSGGGNDA